MSKVIKQMQMDALAANFQGVADMVLLSIKGLSCHAEGSLRAILRKKKIRLQMVKNSYTRRVFNQMGISIPVESPVWQGNTVVAWGAGSPAELSRSIETELKDVKKAAGYKDKVTIKTGIAEGQLLPFEQMTKLPTRQEALSLVLGAILGPASSLVSQINGPAGTVAGQVKTKGEEKAGDDAPPPA